MKTEEIVKALRCVSSAGHEAGCESCSYYRAEYIPEDMRETFGSDVLYSCDIDRVGLDGADLIQHLTDRCAVRRGDRRTAGAHAVDSGGGAAAGG